jgi:putative hydrolase of the HAD superfamily
MKVKNYDAVFFDAHDTIIHLSPDAPEIYYLVGKKYGSKASVDDFKKVYYAIRDEWFAHPLRQEAIESKDQVKRKAWWKMFAEAVYKGTGLENFSDEHFEAIYTAFLGNQFWAVYDDVIETIENLKKSGIKLGVISNWDTRLIRILKDVSLHDYFDIITISSEAGFEKPSPEIFRIAAQNANVEIKRSIFVGDSPEKDVMAANQAGMTGILVSRDGLNFPNLLTIYDLREVMNYIYV